MNSKYLVLDLIDIMILYLKNVWTIYLLNFPNGKTSSLQQQKYFQTFL